MIILYTLCILLMFVSTVLGIICAMNLMMALVSLWLHSDERELEARCKCNVPVTIVGWSSRSVLTDAKENRHKIRYYPKYEYEFNGEKYRADGKVGRYSPDIGLNHININPDNPSEIFELDSIRTHDNLRFAVKCFILALITYVIAHMIGVEEAMDYMSNLF